MHKKYIILIVIVTIILVISGIVLNKNKGNDEQKIYTKVTRGDFEQHIVITGELEAENSIMVFIPRAELRQVHIWEINVAKLVPLEFDTKIG